MSRWVFVLAVLACLMSAWEGGQVMGAEKAGREIRAAAISFVPTKFDLKGNSDKLEQMYRQAAAGGARIAVVDRKGEVITYGTITVGPKIKRDRKKRDAVERAFLEWRQIEMVRRYRRTQQRLKKKAE